MKHCSAIFAYPFRIVRGRAVSCMLLLDGIAVYQKCHIFLIVVFNDEIFAASPVFLFKKFEKFFG